LELETARVLNGNLPVKLTHFSLQFGDVITGTGYTDQFPYMLNKLL